jgi:hypothetical protein
VHFWTPGVTQLTFAGLGSGLSVLPRLPRGLDGNEATMKKLIAVALILCAAIVLVAMGIIRQANNEQAALWVPRSRIRELRHRGRLLRRSKWKTRKGWPSLAPKVGS